jgi:hypothetical protein
MFTTNRIYVAGVVVSAIVALSMAGCSTAGAARHTEVRVATRLETGSPRLVVAGPARLLHVEVRGRRALNLYSVRRGADGQVSCLDGARTLLRSRLGANNALDLVVAAGEAICVGDGEAGAANPRDTEVSWHARSGTEARVEIAEASTL